MKRTVLLTGFALLLAAGTASAQTSVQLSIGIGVPRPYISGQVFVGRPYLRPVYRPYFYHRHPGFLFDEPRRVIIVDRRGHRFDRDRDFDGDRDRDRHFRDGDRDRHSGRDGDRDRGRDGDRHRDRD